MILGLDLQQQYKLGTYWGDDGKIHLHKGYRILVNSINAILPGQQLRTIPKVTVPPRSAGTIPTKMTDPHVTPKPCIFEV